MEELDCSETREATNSVTTEIRAMPVGWRPPVELAFELLSLPAGVRCVSAFTPGKPSTPKEITPIPTASDKKIGREAQRRAEFDLISKQKILVKDNSMREVSSHEITELNYANKLEPHRQEVAQAKILWELTKEEDSPSQQTKRQCLENLKNLLTRSVPEKDMIDLTKK